MIYIPRILVEYNLIYDNVYLYEQHELSSLGYQLLFEDDTTIFAKGSSTYMVPRTNIVYLEFKKGRILPPPNAFYFKRITLSYEITFSDVYVISEAYYDKFKVPHIFKELKQFTFIDKHGMYITHDDQIILTQLA